MRNKRSYKMVEESLATKYAAIISAVSLYW